MPSLITLPDILAARDRIAGTAVRTPLVRLTRARLRMAGFPELSENAPDIYLKDESAQPIGSFKLRGAYNKIASLSPDELRRGVITYSSGNHAQGVAFAAKALGAKALIVMPSNAPRIKREATAALGAEIVEVGPASTERRLRAEALAATHGYTMVPPYDDDLIIAGQATCGLEILEQLPNAGLVLAPVSGGGLLSGVATAIKLAGSQTTDAGVAHPSQSHRDGWGTSEARTTTATEAGVAHPSQPHRDGWGTSEARTTTASEAGVAHPSQPHRDGWGTSEARTNIPIFGCEPALAADAKQSFDTRTLTEWPAADTTRTLADGLRTQSLGERNFAHILQHVDGIVTVTEAEIRTALTIILRATALTAEPSGAVTLAAALFHAHELPKAQKIVCILSGGNLDPALRAELLA